MRGQVSVEEALRIVQGHDGMESWTERCGGVGVERTELDRARSLQGRRERG